jgi:hypothetical protein
MMNIELVLFGVEKHTTTDEILDLIILLGTFYVYKCRINDILPNIQQFKKELKYKYEMEKFAHALEMRQQDFQRKWFPYIDMLNM